MKTTVYSIITMLALVGMGCNNSQEVQKFRMAAYKDSTVHTQLNQKDSEISSYLGEMRQIGDNLDRIKSREKIITLNEAELNPTNKDSLVADVKELDEWIVMNDKKMNRL